MSENQNRGIRNFSKYDTMETEELEEILRLDAEAPGGAESDTELILYVMEVLARRRNNVNSTGNNAQKAWDSFQQNYLSKEYLENAPKKEHKCATPWMHRLIATAAVVALIIAIPVSANALSFEKIWDIFTRWAKETFSFVSEENTEVSDPNNASEEDFTSLQDALVKSNRSADFLPIWIPDGYVLDKIEKVITPTQEIYRAYYVNGDKVLRIRVQTYLSDVIQNIEIDDSNSEIYSVSGVDYFIFNNVDQCRAVWITGVYECVVSGDLSIEEIKLMIDSIGKG